MTIVNRMTRHGCYRAGFPALLVLAFAGTGAALAQTEQASDPSRVQVRQFAAAALALAFLLEPDGVKIHWVTDGAYAVAGSDPANQTAEPEHRRGGKALPLRANDWNRMAIALHGDTVDLTLNGRLIYQRPLEVTNQRTFGLFHFADQTEVRVRRVVLRGAWPKSLPSAADQELADKSLSSVTIRAEKMTYFPPDDGLPTRRLIVMNADGSGMREVTGPPPGYTNLGSPVWSADGQQVAFDATSGNFSSTHMFVVNTNGTDVRGRGLGAMPSFSLDGKRIVFSQPGSGVMMMKADGSNREDVDASGWGAQWSPDGKWIAWGRGGNIIVMNANTKQQKPLLVGEQATLFNYTYWNLGWSHDSRSIAFKARNQRTGGEDVVVADIDSPRGFKILLASSQAVHPDFSFSPDNQRILFAMHNPLHKGPQLYTIDRDKGGPPKLLPGQPLDWIIYNGDWSPDGKQIAFTGEKPPQPVDWPLSEVSASKE